MQEKRSAAIAAAWLEKLGYAVTREVGVTGVVGVLRNGDGPTVMLRADMDALPMDEATGLPYSSEVSGVAHSCGHDMHMAWLMGAARVLAEARDAEGWHSAGMNIVLTEFARSRLFRDRRRNTIQDITPEAFERHLNTVAPVKVLDGYAPFCKLHVHRNWTSTRCLAVPIDDDNRHLLRSDYEARTPDELPVLVRWFEGLEPPVAEYLVVILYDRAQLAKEGTAIDADWGVVGCMYTAEPVETPMAPITMMRNALGVEEGGSGVPIDRAAYQRAVEFWRTHANWRG